MPLEAGTHGFRSVAPTATRPQLKLAGAIERTRPSTVPSHRLAAGAYCGLMISRPVMIEQVTTARRNETSVACVARAMIGAASAIDAGGGGALLSESLLLCANAGERRHTCLFACPRIRGALHKWLIDAFPSGPAGVLFRRGTFTSHGTNKRISAAHYYTPASSIVRPESQASRRYFRRNLCGVQIRVITRIVYDLHERFPLFAESAMRSQTGTCDCPHTHVSVCQLVSHSRTFLAQTLGYVSPP